MPRSAPGGRTLEDKYYVANFLDYRFLQVFYPTRGILAWYDRDTKRLQPLPGANDPRYVQTGGVWSPDGKYIVFARAEAQDALSAGCPDGPLRQRSQRNADPIRPVPDSVQRRKGWPTGAHCGRLRQRHEQQLSEGIAGWPLDRVCGSPQRHGDAPGRQALHRAVRGRRSPADEVQHAADELVAHLLAERPLAGVLVERAVRRTRSCT